MRVFRDNETNLAPLADATIGVIGYGNQGRAHALNLRDTGLHVIVGQRAGVSYDRALGDGFAPVAVEEAAARSNLLILGLPDDRMATVYRAAIEPHLRPGTALGFIHGFNIHFGRITPPPTVDVVLVAPKGPGRLLRQAFVDGRGIAALTAVHQSAPRAAAAADPPTAEFEPALARALAWAKGIGCTRVGVLETTFAHETVTDLFGEQTVLCGGAVELMKCAFTVLVDAGYPPELAYFECVHELKQVMDLVYERGLDDMRRRISTTACFGGLLRGPQMTPPAVVDAMRDALREIESGEFAKRLLADADAGAPQLRQLLESERAHPLNHARAALESTLGPLVQSEAELQPVTPP